MYARRAISVTLGNFNIRFLSAKPGELAASSIRKRKEISRFQSPHAIARFVVDDLLRPLSISKNLENRELPGLNLEASRIGGLEVRKGTKVRKFGNRKDLEFESLGKIGGFEIEKLGLKNWFVVKFPSNAGSETPRGSALRGTFHPRNYSKCFNNSIGRVAVENGASLSGRKVRNPEYQNLITVPPLRSRRAEARHRGFNPSRVTSWNFRN